MSENSEFEIVGVVTQPPAPAGRKKKLTNSPVHDFAISSTAIANVLYPDCAKDESFLSSLEELDVDLMVTAAYGNFLPKKFLGIPKYGTVNIHPSMLPKYRGAAPVQRCLENGDPETAISILWTVLKMDAGSIISNIQL